MLCIDKRYVVVVVPEDSFPIGIELPLNNLQWISFQTRTFQNDIDTKLPSQNYISKKTDFMDDIIDISNREINKFTYFSRKYPIKVEILNMGKNSTMYDYSDKATISTALETFNCILSFNF